MKPKRIAQADVKPVHVWFPVIDGGRICFHPSREKITRDDVRFTVVRAEVFAKMKRRIKELEKESLRPTFSTGVGPVETWISKSELDARERYTAGLEAEINSLARQLRHAKSAKKGKQ